ncbi:hypothetical protein JB92DRAFT_3042908 [Gautieria morchelliformis]|nr:hypothetical protein JB92DRAFT_3042908 [Gautieria morchelliformis]
MQTVLQYLRTFILASLPPALPSALPGARPRSSSSPLRSSPGRTHIPTPCAWRSSSPFSSTNSLHTPCSAQSSMIMSMQRLYATSLLLEGEIEIRLKILIVGWGFRRPFPIAPQHP